MYLNTFKDISSSCSCHPVDANKGPISFTESTHSPPCLVKNTPPPPPPRTPAGGRGGGLLLPAQSQINFITLSALPTRPNVGHHPKGNCRLALAVEGGGRCLVVKINPRHAAPSSSPLTREQLDLLNLL